MLADPHGNLNQWLNGITLVPLGAPRWKMKKGEQYLRRICLENKLYYIERGRGRCQLGAAAIRIGAGDLIVVPERTELSLDDFGPGGLQFVVAYFHARIFSYINLLKLTGFPVCIRNTRNTPIAVLMEQAAREQALKAPGWKTAMAAQITLLLLYIMRHYGSAFTGMLKNEFPEELPRLLPVLEWLDKNLDNRQFKEQDLARRISLSPAGLRRLFKKVVRVNPVRYIQQKRIEKACFLLRNETLSIPQVAAATGFADVAFFYRVFKKHQQTTPAQYQRAATRELTMP